MNITNLDTLTEFLDNDYRLIIFKDKESGTNYIEVFSWPRCEPGKIDSVVASGTTIEEAVLDLATLENLDALKKMIQDANDEL